jgi:hypothetical protein
VTAAEEGISFIVNVTDRERNVTALSLAVVHEGGKAHLTRLNITQTHHGSTIIVLQAA